MPGELMTKANTVLNVRGMTCASCAYHVIAALSDLDGVGKVDVRVREGQVVVEHNGELISVAQLIAALDETGYEASTSSD
jgi:copper chaperone